MLINVKLGKGIKIMLLTVREFADKVKLHPRYVTQLIREGKIYAMRPGKRTYRIPDTELERLVIASQCEEK